MSIFGGSAKSPTRINNVQMTQSSLGRCVPSAMGQVRIHQSLIWQDGLTSTAVSQGGKGGGKGSSGVDYAADTVAALCNGVVEGVTNVWLGQSWLSNMSGTDSISIPASLVYATPNAAVLSADNGIVFATTYNNTYTDFGAPAATILSGTDYAPLTKVPYVAGQTLATGTYSVNPASIGTFTLTACAAASGGNTVYTGTITGGTAPYTSGGSNAYIGFVFIVTGFQNAANNGTYTCTASTAGTLTLNNAGGVAETYAGTAADSGNTYHFASADAGQSAVVSYQLSLQNFFNQETDMIPANGVVSVGGGYYPTVDGGTFGRPPVYTSGANQGQAFKLVSTPTAAGQYSYSTPGVGQSMGGANYTFYVGAGGDLGQSVLITWQYQNLGAVTGKSNTLLNFELANGNFAQPVNPYLLSGDTAQFFGTTLTEPSFPGAALGYSNTAYLLYYPMSLGESGTVPDITVEIKTPDSYGGVYSSGPSQGKAIVDCNPVTCIMQVLTNPVWGLGNSMIPFPASAIDNGSVGTWGGPAGTPGTRVSGSTAWNWFASNSFFISPLLDDQDSASSIIEKWLEAGQCAAFMSEGVLKLTPYGTQSTAGNGCTWVAPQAAVAAFDDTCFISKDGEDPVKITRTPYADAYNEVQVNFYNRNAQYSNELIQEFDQASINRWGLRLEDPQDWNFIHTLDAATFAANMRVKRSVNVRNNYTFTVPFIYSYVECMDIVTISTTSSWAAGLNNINLGVVNLPVRVIKVVDDPEAGIELTCEDSLFSAGIPVLYNKQISSGDPVVNAYTAPGNTIAVMFEAPSRLSGYTGNEIWIGACGTTDQWGGCQIWASQDGTKYANIGEITAQARIGTLASTFAAGSDPDTADNLVVNMVENTGGLDAGTSADADMGNTLCFVDGEIIAYSACALSGQNQYTMGTYIRRGLKNSPIESHLSGSLFLRLDTSIFKYKYDSTWAGQTIYLKFASFNIFNQMNQPLSTLTPVTFVVPGLGPGTIDQASGLIIAANTFNQGAGPENTTPVAMT